MVAAVDEALLLAMVRVAARDTGEAARLASEPGRRGDLADAAHGSRRPGAGGVDKVVTEAVMACERRSGRWAGRRCTRHPGPCRRDQEGTDLALLRPVLARRRRVVTVVLLQ